MSYDSSSLQKNSSIYPYYKPTDVFERDQEYYSQLLNNTRRPQQQAPRFGYEAVNSNNINSNYGYQGNQVQTRYQEIPRTHQQVIYQPGTQINPQPSRQIYTSLNSQSNPYNPNYVPQRPQVQTYINNQQYRRQLQENKALKRKIDDLVNYRDANEDGEDIIKKAHYNSNSQEGRLVQTQQREIQSLLESIKRNNNDIDKYRRAVIQLQKSMTNIQSVDREIYKQLKATSNRDQQLLDKATTALAKGASRQQVAQILERIVS